VALAFAYYATPKALVVGYQPSQPIPFSHKIHVDQLGLDCRYCHSFVDVAGHSNVPTGNTCWNCHQHIQRDSPKLAPLHRRWTRRSPATTASRSSGCASTNPRITSISTTPRTSTAGFPARAATATSQDGGRLAGPAHSMGWCLDCHRAPEKHLRPLEEVYNFGYDAETYLSNNPQLGRQDHRRTWASSSRSSSRSNPRKAAPPATIDPPVFPNFLKFPQSNMSKRIWQHPEVPAGETTVAWRSAGQLEDTRHSASGWTVNSRREPPKWRMRTRWKPRAARSSS
jgi:hypothetical protein